MDVTQHIHQVADVETDFKLSALISDFQLFACFFLLVVATYDTQQTRLQEQSRTAEFFIGKNGGTFERTQKLGTGYEENLVVIQRNHAVKVRELTVDDFADNGRAVALEAYLIIQKLNGDGLGRIVQQLEEFQYRFTRQDDFCFRQFRFNLAGCISKAVAVGCNKAQLVAFNLHQQAVEVIADVLNRHAVLHLRKHGFEGFLSQRESRADIVADTHQRKVFCRQGLQGKTGFARTQSQTVVRPI